MSKSTSADSGEPEDHGRGDAAPEGAEGTDRPHSDGVTGDDVTAADETAADAETSEPADTSSGAEKDKDTAKPEPADKAKDVAAAKSDGRPRSTSVRSARSARVAGGSSSGRPTSVRAAEAGKGRATTSRAEAEAARTTRPNVFARIIRYVREVIAELRKVVTPTRNELFTYATVVVVFLIIMMAYVGALDYGIGRLVLWAFGG